MTQAQKTATDSLQPPVGPPPVCPLCGSPPGHFKQYAPDLYEHKGTTYSLVKCKRCGLIRVSPFPAEETVRTFYGAEYFEKDFSFGILEGDYLASNSARQGEYAEILSLIKEWMLAP